MRAATVMNLALANHKSNADILCFRVGSKPTGAVWPSLAPLRRQEET